MSMVGGQSAETSQPTRAVAEQVLQLVRARASAGVQAEVNVDRSAQALTRFANSAIHQNLAEQSTTVRLRLHLDARTAAASTARTTPEGLAALVERTAEAVRVAPADPGWPGLAAPAPATGEPGFDQATAAASPRARADRVAAFVARTGGLNAAGYCRTSYWSGAFANSAGQSIAGHGTEAAFDGLARGAGGDGVARGAGGDGVARQAAASLAELDADRLGALAAAKARAGADPVDLPPGHYPVVLEPNAVADLLTHLAMSGFNGKAYAEGLSFLRLGQPQLDPAITVVDDSLSQSAPGFPYDAEGTPKQRLVLVDAGLSAAVAHDRRSAAMLGGGAVSTGHALPGGGAFGAVPLNLALLPDSGPVPASGNGAGSVTGLGTAPDADPAVDPGAAPLLAGVERGLLITDLHYTRVLDPKTLVVTGLTRNGVWLIENGAVTAPVRNLRFTQSYPQALAPGAVRRVGRVATVVPAGWGLGWWSAPSLHLASWQITGNAQG